MAIAGFTWSDLERLGGKLGWADDSAWLPSPLREVLIDEIRFALDPRHAHDGQPLATAVSERDLYHGHLKLPPGDAVPPAVASATTALMDAYRDAMGKAYQIWQSISFPAGAITERERAAIRDLDAAFRDRLRGYVTQLMRDAPASTVVTFHSYEHDKPVLRNLDGSPRKRPDGTPLVMSPAWPGRYHLWPLFRRGKASSGDRMRDRYIEGPKHTATTAATRAALLEPAPAIDRPTVGTDDGDRMYPSMFGFYFLVDAAGAIYFRAFDVSLWAAGLPFRP